MDFPTAHALLRDRRSWTGTTTALAVDADGDLTLARVPAPADGQAVVIATSYPSARQASGIAAGPCNAVFIADTADNQLLYVDGLCNAQSLLPANGTPSDLPGHFNAPRGLATSAEGLQVADSGNARVQGLAFPRLEAHLAISGFVQPFGVAVDSTSRLLVVDATGVHRLQHDLLPDMAFDQAVATSGGLVQPMFIAIGKDDTLFVADIGSDRVALFDTTGQLSGSLTGPAGWQPGALACAGDVVYVADAASGAIQVFAGTSLQGPVNGWRGPVTALAIDADGGLLIKPDLGTTFYRFAADRAYVPQGQLLAGPFDAGVARAWERALVQAQVPTSTLLTMEVALQAAPTPAPTAWIALPSPDALLELLLADEDARRFVWFRLTLSSSSPAASPKLCQVRAATAAEDYLDYLPMTYRLHDKSGFLSRWLRELRGEFSQVEEALDDMPRVADPSFSASSSLPWLAQWLALELPRIADDDQRRALISRAVALYARRGTKDSIAGFVELHTGIKPAIVEAFAARSVWVLGQTSRLGFDTRLPALDPMGMIVPDEAVADPCCPGPIGQAIVGASGPLASYQIGMPLFADAAFRFCVVVDAYRVHDPATLQELRRIVEREKPAHTDYRVQLVAPDLRVGLQCQVGLDTLVGGDAPPWRLTPVPLGIDTCMPPTDVSRVGDALIDGTLTLL